MIVWLNKWNETGPSIGILRQRRGHGVGDDAQTRASQTRCEPIGRFGMQLLFS